MATTAGPELARDGLCHLCARFNIQSFDDKTSAFPWRGYKLGHLRSSIWQGCNFCVFLYHVFLDAGYDLSLENPQHEYLNFAPVRTEGPAGEGLEIVGLRTAVMSQPGPPGGPHLVFLQTVAELGNAATRTNDIAGRFFPDDTSAVEYVSRVKEWLRGCLAHPRCCRTLSGSEPIQARLAPLPTRFIEIDIDRCLQMSLEECVGRVRRGDEPTWFRLRELPPPEPRPTGEAGAPSTEFGSYVALSHRWTEADTKRCSTYLRDGNPAPDGDQFQPRANYHLRLQGKGFQNLERRFLDVFRFAAQLGIRNVWIDCLCIQQDGENNQDWPREAVKMAQYYQNAYLTVAITEVAAERGLFRQGTKQHPRLSRLPYRRSDGSRSGYFYLHAAEEVPKERYRDSIAQSELLDRGWVFQEWILSRRIVAFTKTGMFLQCCSRYPQSESGSSVTDKTTPADVVDMSMKNLFSIDASAQRSKIDSIWLAWEQSVQVYSRSQLTVKTDKLKALSGVADEFGRAIDAALGQRSCAAYDAGLWGQDLARGLLWEQARGGRHARLPWIPSWSWASVVAPVRWSPRPRKVAQVLNVCATCRYRVPDFTEQQKEQMRNGDFNIVNMAAEFRRGALEDAPDARHAKEERHIFSVLNVHGPLAPVLIRGGFPDASPSDIAARHTGMGDSESDSDSDSDRRHWRVVAFPAQRNMIQGWASVEHPDFQVFGQDTMGSSFQQPLQDGLLPLLNLADSGPETEVLALLVSRTTELPDGALLGYPRFSTHSALNVLFLRRVDASNPWFERVGVGKLFGKEAEAYFQAASWQNISLF